MGAEPDYEDLYDVMAATERGECPGWFDLDGQTGLRGSHHPCDRPVDVIIETGWGGGNGLSSCCAHCVTLLKRPEVLHGLWMDEGWHFADGIAESVEEHYGRPLRPTIPAAELLEAWADRYAAITGEEPTSGFGVSKAQHTVRALWIEDVRAAEARYKQVEAELDRADAAVTAHECYRDAAGLCPTHNELKATRVRAWEAKGAAASDVLELIAPDAIRAADAVVRSLSEQSTESWEGVDDVTCLAPPPLFDLDDMLATRTDVPDAVRGRIHVVEHDPEWYRSTDDLIGGYLDFDEVQVRWRAFNWKHGTLRVIAPPHRAGFTDDEAAKYVSARETMSIPDALSAACGG